VTDGNWVFDDGDRPSGTRGQRSASAGRLKQTTLDVAAILRGIWRRHKLLLLGLFLGLALPLGGYVYWTSVPLFVSTSTIVIEPSPLDVGVARDLPRRDNIATYAVILKSRSLSEAVVEALPKESFDELLANSQYTDYVLTLANFVRARLGKPLKTLSPQQRAIEELQNARMEFAQSKQSPGIFTIKGTASNPRVAMDLVNSHVQVLIGRTRNVNQEDAQKARQFLEEQTKQGKDTLDQAEGTLAKFQQQRGRLTLGSQAELDLARLSQLQSALGEAQASREVLSARIAGLRQALAEGASKSPALSAEKEGAGTLGPSAEILVRLNAFKAAQERLGKLEARLNALRERYTDGHPLVQTTQEDVAKEQARVTQLAREIPAAPTRDAQRGRPVPATAQDRTDAARRLEMLEAEEAALQSKADALKLQLEPLKRGVKNLTKDELEFSNLRRGVEANRNLLTVLSDKLMAARMREQGDAGVIRIIDPAAFPILPTQSHTQRALMMIALLAAGLAFGTAFGVEVWKQPVETELDIRKATGLRVLGSIGLLPPAKPGAGAAFPATGARFAEPHFELFRRIAAAVESQRRDAPFRTLLVTSANPHEGKSTTLLHLAQAFQEFGRRVLVIEADLRRPVLSRRLAVVPSPGLVDVLTDSVPFEQACRVLPSGITFLPGQVVRGEAPSLLASPEMKALLDKAAARFDLILVDSPPVLAVPDNLLLSAVMDRVLLVAKASSTGKRDLLNTIETLAEAGADLKILGVVLNQAQAQDVPYYHPRYQRYYSAGDGKESREDRPAVRRRGGPAAGPVPPPPDGPSAARPGPAVEAPYGVHPRSLGVRADG
jgi:polysaccharide biosynthesis transport protein